MLTLYYTLTQTYLNLLPSNSTLIGEMPVGPHTKRIPNSKITMAGDVVPYYTVTALVPTLK